MPDLDTRPPDRHDRQILRRLQQDGRLPLSQLARDIHLSVTACKERVKRLERQGYIRGYHAALDAARLGDALLAYIQVHLDRTTPDVFERFKLAMQSSEQVLECHMVAGGFDYLIKVRVRDMNAYRRFLGENLSGIRGVMQTHTYVVMEEVKATQFVPVAEH
jgi:Lrp/AsnC family transcriptional regulator, leucine-responsive regulatory protein